VAEFLTIYTPTYRRPNLLAACVASVDRQTARADIQHVIVRDAVGIGIAGMFAAIPDHLGELRGKYIYLLQDDDTLIGPDVVHDLRAFVAEQGDPAVVIVKVRKRGQVLPTFWGVRPRQAHIDLGNYVVRCDVFAKHVGDFGARYEGDFDFIDRLWRAGRQFAWFDRLFAHAQVVGMGRPEAEIEEAIVKAPERAVGRRVR
jgi:GT2 family glycosyltransferase